MATTRFAAAFFVLAVGLAQCKKLHLKPYRKEISHESHDEYFQAKHKRGAFFFKDKGSTGCTYKGYPPNGPSVDRINGGLAKEAKDSLEAVLAGPGKTLGKMSGVKLPNIQLNVMQNFPALAPALAAIYGSYKSGENWKGTVYPQDLLDIMNKLIKELSDGAMEQVKEMENYVGSSIARRVQHIQTEYLTSFRMWANCIQESSEWRGIECQEDAVKHIAALMPRMFTPEEGNLGGDMTMAQVRNLEAHMKSFRNYANLLIMALSTTSEYYCLKKKNALHADQSCKEYADELISVGAKIINYATGAIAAIKKAHETGPCRDTKSCSCKKVMQKNGGWFEEHVANNCECKCAILNGEKKEYCKVLFLIRVDGQGRRKQYSAKSYNSITSFNEAQEFYGNSLLDRIAQKDQIKNRFIINKFWDENVLNFVPLWQKAIELAKEMKTKHADESVLVEGFSRDYVARFD